MIEKKSFTCVAFANDPNRAKETADLFYRIGRKVSIVEVSHAREQVGQDIRTIYKYAIVEWSK